MKAFQIAQAKSYKSFGAWSRFYSKNPEPNLPPLPKRAQELRERLKQERQPYVFEISQGGKRFLEKVNSDLNTKYSLGGPYGEGYVEVKEVIKIAGDNYYGDNEKISVLSSDSHIQD